MNIITDSLLIAGALSAGVYCFVLGQRLRRLGNLRSGVGGAIVGMTRALEDARQTLEQAKAASRDSNTEFRELIGRAEAVSGQLRILLAATRDLPMPLEERTGSASAGEADPPDESKPVFGSARPGVVPSAPPSPVPATDMPEPDQRRSLGPAPLPVVPRSRRQTASPAENDPPPAPADFAAAQG